MKNKVNILVTGCGGDIGQSIGKILNESTYVKGLYGCDISGKNAAKFIFENFFIGLPVSDPGYINYLKKIVVEKEIDLIIPVSEPELRFFSSEGILDRIGKAKLLLASGTALAIGFDKLKTANFLKEQNLPFPETRSVNNIQEIENFPVILKSRTGSGSSNVHIVENNESFRVLKHQHPDFIVQEYLDGSKGEYTCGVFRSQKGKIRTIIFKRELTGGFSGYGEVMDNSDIHRILIDIAEKMDVIGSINVQLRLTSKGPVVFEINPRFSSTVRFRHLLGFKDLEWCLEDALKMELSGYSNNAIGRKFYKGFNEYIQ